MSSGLARFRRILDSEGTGTDPAAVPDAFRFPYMILTHLSLGYQARPRILGDLAESQTQE